MVETKDIKRIGLIAGNGKFPIFLSQIAKAQNIDILVIAINGEATPDLARYATKLCWIDLGQGEKLIEILKNESIKHVVMAGKIKKITIFKQTFKMDKTTRDVLKGVIDRKDDTLLKAVEKKLKSEGIELIGSKELLKSLLAKKGLYTKKDVTPPEREDIFFGFEIAKAMGGLDIGQTVVIKDKAVIAVEAIEGTDEAIIRAGNFTPGTVVVKVSKPKQDMRFDVPTVGVNTIKAMEKSGASVLAIEAEKTLIIEKDIMIREADKAGICIVAI